MASTFGGLEIAKSGMMTYNKAIQVTGHNVANVYTKGYSRQKVRMSAMVANRSSLMVQGYGVTVDEIYRERNEYYDTKFQKTTSTYYRYDMQSYYLNQIQDKLCSGIANEGDENKDKTLLTDAFDTFYAALSNLAGNPNNGTVRRQSISVAETFASAIQSAATSLQNLQQEANDNIRITVEQINAYADKIVSINRQINTVEAYGSTANDLRDQRSQLIDELSKYCNVTVSEKMPPDGVGVPQYYVYVNGGVLVDTYTTNKMEIVQKQTYSSINDIKGCYSIQWEDGTPLNPYTNELGGQLQALFEMRDGNNGTVLQGKANAVSNNADGNLVLTITDANCNDVQQLNIPAQDGEIIINGRTYAYENFEVTVGEDGNFTYQFTLSNKVPADEATLLNIAVAGEYNVSVGRAIDMKGIPYYMAQLNEFVRTFSQEFNTVHKQGYDLNDNQGIDFFNATVAATGDNFVFTEKTDGRYSAFSSVPEADENGVFAGSYYYMTALNFSVTKKLHDNPDLIAAKGRLEDGGSLGSDNADNLQKLTELKDKADMFVYGAPDKFIQAMTATLGVDAQKSITLAKSQSDLLYSIDINRQSVSGVDEDEEGANMIIFQQMLRNQYKVLSVMNEVLDKLINQTAI